MKLLLFRTDIKTKKRVNTIKPFFNNHASISKWSVDTEDIDNVLRIEANDNLNENDVVAIVKTEGFYCSVLTD